MYYKILELGYAYLVGVSELDHGRSQTTGPFKKPRTIAVANERGNEQSARNTFAFRPGQPESGVKRVPTGVNEANYGLILISQLAMRPRYTVPPAPTVAPNLRRYRLNVEFDLKEQN